MGKRVLSSPKKGSPKKRVGAGRKGAGSSGPTSQKPAPSRTVSVAELFSKQRSAKSEGSKTIKDETHSEIIDISDSPVKDTTSTKDSPYFSPTKDDKLKKTHSLPTRRNLSRLSLKSKTKSEPPEFKPESRQSDVQESSERDKTKTRVEGDLVNNGGSTAVDGGAKHKKSRLSLGKRKRDSVSQVATLGPRSEEHEEASKKHKTELIEGDTKDEVKAVDTDSVKDEVENDPEEGEQYRVPYYVENFKLIVKSILEDSYYEDLFDQQDLATVEAFNGLSDEGQKLYVRLFGRKLKWIPKAKIKYPKIAEDLSEAFNELVRVDLLLDEKGMNDLEEVLRVLPAPELQSLAKGLKLNLKNQQKQQLAEAVLKHSKQKHIGAFFKQAANTSTIVMKRARDLLGKCYKVAKEPRAVFSRLMMLFSLHLVTGDEDEAAGQQQIFQMLMSNIGRIKYPSFTVFRETKIYKSREDLLRFETAIQLSSDLYDAFEGKDFDLCMDLYRTAKTSSKDVWESKQIKTHDESLPEYLRWFTAGAVYARVFTYGVEVLQRKKLYQDAVEQLQELTAQKVYHPDYRGRWYDRLALNTDQHLKQAGKALDIIKEALVDDRVRAGHRLSLFQRASRICHANQHKKLHGRWTEFKDDPMAAVEDAPKVTIEGTLCPHSMPGEQRMWVSKDSYSTDNDDVTLIKRVEDVVLVHLRDNGYPNGIHGEGGTFSTLFCLFFWDIIFKDEIPDTFHSAYQTGPLDYSTDHFYLNRKDLIDERLETIRTSSEEGLHEMVSSTWKENYETLCAGLNWERFLDLDHALGLISCMGGKILAGIFERKVKNMRHVRSGVPDLVVWNTETKKFKIVEVKGPNDRLSTKQILWLDYLVRLGAEAETCHVVAVAAKKLKKSSSTASTAASDS